MPRILLALVVYAAVVACVFALKPAFIFTEDGQFKAPGLAQDGMHSAMAAAVFFPLLAAIVYYLVAVLLNALA